MVKWFVINSKGRLIKLTEVVTGLKEQDIVFV